MSNFILEDCLEQLKNEYERKNKKPIYFNFRKNSSKILNGFSHDDKTLHYIHTYPGRISPHIVLSLLSLNELKSLKGYVLDPFSGSGTILLESLINPVIKRPALGVEINPIARLIAKVKTSLIDKRDIEKHLEKIRKIYDATRRNDYVIPDFANIDLWFSGFAKSKLSKLKLAIENAPLNDKYRDFFWVCFSKIIRKVSKTDPNIAPPVLLKPSKYKHNLKEYNKLKKYLSSTDNPQVWKLFEKSVKENIKLTVLNKIKDLKNNKIQARIISDNAKQIRKGEIKAQGRINVNENVRLNNGTIDIILTSPPYLTAQKYIRSTRLELLWLGYSSKELSNFESNTIGSESVAVTTPITNFNIDSIDQLLKYTHKKSKARGVMIYEYFFDMKIVLTELYRVLRKSGYAIFVMGDNVVLKRQVKTYRLLTDLAQQIGFKEVVILKDKIRNRSMLTKRNGTGGLIKNEYIIILRK